MSFWSSPCAGCKFLRRKCTQLCVLAPYFPPNEPYKFLCLHRVFGASNITKILNDISPEQRGAAVSTLVYEADARIKNPVYGCVGYISLLQQQLLQLRKHADKARKKLATYIGPAAFDPFLFSAPAPSQFHHPQFQGSAPFAEQEMMGLGLATGAATPQPMIWDQSQSQMLVEARPMVEVGASDAAQEQQMFGSYDQQQQQELLRQSSVHNGCGIYNNVVVAASDAAQEQQMFGSYDQQQQQEILRLSSVHNACGIYNNVVVAASDAAQEQQMFGSNDQQQQQELLRLSSVHNACGIYNNVVVAASDAAREQQMFGSNDQQQQQELLRLSSVHNACGIYNNVVVAAPDAAQEQQMFGSYDQQQQQELLRLLDAYGIYNNVEQGGGAKVAIAGATGLAGGLSLHPPSHHHQNLPSSTPSKEMRNPSLRGFDLLSFPFSQEK